MAKIHQDEHNHAEVGMTYIIELVQDGDTVGVFHFDSAITAVEAWHKFNDYGDAKDYRAITFKSVLGENQTKYFEANN